ncbi:MAG TPA: VOC family protein [Spirochaetota bacterium]|nr:VOC family protein [Spirochaetota bacterium]HPI91155.1 VOC family protein [Spirochaetota bacterium]HPR49463.1 VOC family protein [Spirochaetota bacterium]
MVFNDISGMQAHVPDELNLPRVSQIGLTVPDIDRGIRYYRNLLNVKKWYRTKILGAEYFYRGKPVDLVLNIAVGYTGGMQVELIEHRSDEENIYTRYASPGGFGYHHLGVAVSDLDRKVALLGDMGIIPLQTGTIRFGRGGVTRFAYLDTVERAGFILELIETRAFGLYLGMPEWVVNLGRLTGDTQIIPAERKGSA